GEMGIFSAADRWRTAIMFIPGLLGGVALPLLSNLSPTAAGDEYRRVLWANVGVSVLLSSAVAIPVCLAAPWIMASYGSGFAEGRWILVGLAAAAVITSTSSIFVLSIISQGRMWLVFFLNLGWGILLVGCCWMLRTSGASGLVAAYLFAEGTRLIMVMWLLHATGESRVCMARRARS